MFRTLVKRSFATGGKKRPQIKKNRCLSIPSLEGLEVTTVRVFSHHQTPRPVAKIFESKRTQTKQIKVNYIDDQLIGIVADYQTTSVLGMINEPYNFYRTIRIRYCIFNDMCYTLE